MSHLAVNKIMPSTKIKDESYSKTINPWSHSNIESISKIVLTPIINNKIEKKSSIKFDNADSIILNRKKLDPKNETISVKTHAQLICTNGKWSLVNKSRHKTTLFRFKIHMFYMMVISFLSEMHYTNLSHKSIV